MRHLPQFRVVLFAVFLGGATVFSAEDEANGAKFRAVEVRVLDSAGKPAAHVEVLLRGLERDATGINALSIQNGWLESAPPGWRFVTDSDGRFTVRFGMFGSIEHEESGHQYLPGWGAFYFVAMQSGTAGAVSPRIENYSGKRGERGSLPSERDEWSRGRTIRLRNEKTRVSMQFQRGLRVTGRVIDRLGHPIEGLEMLVTHDLHVWSHTGYGGEIFAQTAFSDRAGRFSFERVYPARFDLGLLSRKPEVFWVKTKVRRQWSGERVDEIVPRAGERSISVEIVAAREIPYRYFGRVTHSAKQPVSGAKVVIGVSFHRNSENFADDHTFLDGQTDQDGRYEIPAGIPFLHFIRVSAPGFKDAMRDFEDRGPLAPPGEYDLSLTPGEAARCEEVAAIGLLSSDSLR